MNSIKSYFSVVALFMCMMATAQTPAKTTSKAPNKKVQVEITDPTIRSVYVMSNYFNDGIKKELLQQITEEQFAQIKSNCNEDDYPACIKELFGENATSSSETKEANPFKKLKIYRIAKFDNIRNGENFGEESVLVVPAAENKNIDGTCSFTDDFYIIIYTTGIKLL
jgi:hypothetical protein